MMRSLWIAKTGMDVQQTRLDVISNNLANAATSGYKKQRAGFEDLLYQTVTQPGALSTQQTPIPSGLQLGAGARAVSNPRDFSQGGLTMTSNPYNMAISGQGFFQIQMPDGTTSYTRDGNFQLDAQGQLVTQAGYPVAPGIVIQNDAQAVTVGKDGVVSVTTRGNPAAAQVGQIQIALFVNPAGLSNLGGNLLAETAASGAPQEGQPGTTGLGMLEQGALENSNVNVVEELVSMIEAQRAYEINSKAITAADQMLAKLSQLS